MRSWFRKSIIVSVLVGAALLNSARAEELRVAAAASLSDALKEISRAYETARAVVVRPMFGASNLLARQIEEGAPVDVFISADDLQMDALQRKGLLAPDTRVALLGNTLAVIVRADSKVTLTNARDLSREEVKKIATGDPQAVPVGIYARQWLERAAIWESVRRKVVATESVRAALAAVEAGNVEAGIVYRTDTRVSTKVKVAFEVPTGEGPVIRYPAAVIKDSAQPSAALAFLRYLQSEAAATVFTRHGFLMLPARP